MEILDWWGTRRPEAACCRTETPEITWDKEKTIAKRIAAAKEMKKEKTWRNLSFEIFDFKEPMWLCTVE